MIGTNSSVEETTLHRAGSSPVTDIALEREEERKKRKKEIIMTRGNPIW